MSYIPSVSWALSFLGGLNQSLLSSCVLRPSSILTFWSRALILFDKESNLSFTSASNFSMKIVVLFMNCKNLFAALSDFFDCNLGGIRGLELLDLVDFLPLRRFCLVSLSCRSSSPDSMARTVLADSNDSEICNELLPPSLSDGFISRFVT